MKKAAARLLAVGAVASIGLLASACGGGGSTPGVASLGTTTTTSAATSGGTAPSGTVATGTKQAGAIKFSKCMRAHGVKNFPEPGNGPTGGGVTIGPTSGIDPNSPTYQAAQKACQSLIPKPSPAQARKAEQNALKFSKCMRTHGVPNFPDPQFSATGGGISIKISGGSGGIDPNSPAFQSAQQACSKYMHLPRGGPGKQSVGGATASAYAWPTAPSPRGLLAGTRDRDGRRHTSRGAQTAAYLPRLTSDYS